MHVKCMLWFESCLLSHAPPSYDAVFSDSAVAKKVLILPHVSTPATHRRQPETPNTGCGARTAAGSLEADFKSSHVEHCAGSARRQAGANPRSRRCSCQSCGRVLESSASRAGGLLADQDRANDFRREIRETHEHRHIIAPDAKPRRHGVDAVITDRKEHVGRRPGLLN